ncbi:MAG: hypothetical protein V4637_17235, partial [Pseudomonadota bacterium]
LFLLAFVAVYREVFETILFFVALSAQGHVGALAAGAAVGLVLPELNGKLDGFAVRVPTINVSLVDLTFTSARPTTVDEVNAIMKAAAAQMKGVLEYTDEPLVSIDFNHNPASSIFDSGLTKVSNGVLVKALAWYDNEWGFSNRMLDTTVALMNAK